MAGRSRHRSPWELSTGSGQSLGPHLMYCVENVKQSLCREMSGLSEVHMRWAATYASILDSCATDPSSQVCSLGFIPLGFDLSSP